MNYKDENRKTYNNSLGFFHKISATVKPRIVDVKKAFSYINKNNPNVIELGCAVGRDAKIILKYTNRYFGVDLSRKLIAVAKKQVPAGKFRVCDIATVIFPKDIDIVFAFASLFHLDDNALALVFKKVYKALNTGGIFYVSLLIHPSHNVITKTEFGNRIYFYHTPEEIKKISKSNKFEIIEYNEQIRPHSLRQSGPETWFTIILGKK